MKAMRKTICIVLMLLILITAIPTTSAHENIQSVIGLNTSIPVVTRGQQNIVLRARQLHEIQWTPKADRLQWGGGARFRAGTTYTGLPYGQPVKTGYVAWDIGLGEFLAAVNDSSSDFYTTYSYYGKIAPSYSLDCSAFVSYAWELPIRQTTRSLSKVADKIDSQSVQALQVGDALNKAGDHVVLISNLQYDSDGNVIAVEIMEQTPPKTRLTRYGAGMKNSLSDLQRKYFDEGYVILRYRDRYNVNYKHNCAVPIDNDHCSLCKDTNLPFRDVGKETWYHDAVIYVHDQQLFTGTSESQFSPNIPTSRGMFITILSRLAGIPEQLNCPGIIIGTDVRIRKEPNFQSETVKYCDKFHIVEVLQARGDWYQVQTAADTGWVHMSLIQTYDNPFSDVSEEKYYADAVAWAKLSGIASGVSDTRFAPEESITREQICALIYNYIRTYNLKLKCGTSQRFSDHDSISDYAIEAVYTLRSAGIISGAGNNLFAPNKIATRAEVAKIMENLHKALQ